MLASRQKEAQHLRLSIVDARVATVHSSSVTHFT
jgi:hypothetical protein